MTTLTINRPHEVVVNDPCTSIADTQFMDAIDVSYVELCAALGPPLMGSSDRKVQAQWVLEDMVTGEIATIYDWLSGGGSIELVHEWNIGGHNKNAIDLVRQTLDNADMKGTL